MSRATPSLLQLPPTRRDNCLACPRHPRYPYRIGICSRHRSLSPGRSSPSTHPLRSAPSHLAWSFQAMGFEAADGQERWRDSVGWWCVGTQSHGNNGCRQGTGGHLRQVSELAHHPTMTKLLANMNPWMLRGEEKARTRSVQNPPLRSIISKNSSYSLLRNQSKRAISKLLQK